MKKLLLFILFPILTYGQVQIGEDIDGEAAGDFSGTSVSLSSDGSVLAIGSPNNAGNGIDSGHVRLYANENGNWVQIGDDIDGEMAGDESGSSLSLSSDGNVVAIGAPFNNGNGTASGHIRVYGNQGGSWVQIGQDIDGEAGLDQSGRSVSLSSDGIILAIGAPGNGSNGTASGHVRVYGNQGGSWVQIGQDIDGESIGDLSGRSVSLSADGSVVAIGAPINAGNGLDSGHVRVYESLNNTWVQIGQDIDSEAIGDRSGTSVSLSNDGNVVAIGAPRNNINGAFSGHLRLYENLGGNWIQIGQDIDSEGSGDLSGSSVSLSGNGNVVAIGAPRNDGNGTVSGHLRLYENLDGSWVQIGQDIDGETAFDFSGESIFLSSDRSTVAIGATGNEGNGEDSGHVRVFDLSALLSTEEFTESSFSLYPNPASTQITIDISQENTLEKATIYNNLGQLVLSSKSTAINTSTLSKGIYIVEVLTNQGASSKKLIIE